MVPQHAEHPPLQEENTSEEDGETERSKGIYWSCAFSVLVRLHLV